MVVTAVTAALLPLQSVSSRSELTHFSNTLPEDTNGKGVTLARRQVSSDEMSPKWATESMLGVLLGMGIGWDVLAVSSSEPGIHKRLPGARCVLAA